MTRNVHSLTKGAPYVAITQLNTGTIPKVHILYLVCIVMKHKIKTAQKKIIMVFR